METVELHRERNRIWYLKNREEILEKRKIYNPRRNELLKKRRHLLGISKNYRPDNRLGLTAKERKRMRRKKYKAMFKGGGPLSIKDIQVVYENNIKKYGTLTCYLCLNSIVFGKDHLEHKTPLSRGGTNDIANLDVACQSCNCKKHNKTHDEYLLLKGAR